jgi:hypothetical protein
VEETPESASARGAGLLGSPLVFDVDSLAQEAQQFFAQIDQLGQELASSLARMNLSSWSFAVAVAATAIVVARRQAQQTRRGSTRQNGADTAFACYPGLGGSWTWQES